MSIDHQKDHFKRSRDEEDEAAHSAMKKRKVESSTNEESTEFQKNIYTSYIKSALEALDNVSFLIESLTSSSRCGLPFIFL
jgi:hypothetical protein